MNLADENQPGLVTGWRTPAKALSLPEVHGSIAVPHEAGFWRKMLAFAGPGYLVAVGYMDPGQLGDRSRGRRPVWLHPALRHHDFQPDGDSAAGARRPPGYRERARSGAGVPRQLLASHSVLPLDSLRNRHRRVRPRRGARSRHRAEPAVRTAADLGRLPHGPRCPRRPVPAASRLPVRRSARRVA